MDPTPGRRLLALGIELQARVSADAIGILAGSLTYGAFLSLPPLLMIMLSMAGTSLRDDPTAAQDVIDAVSKTIPGLEQVVNTTITVQSAQQVGLGIIGALTVVWAASGFAARARNALGTILRTERTGLVIGRASAALLGTPILLLFLVLAVAGGLSAGLRIAGSIPWLAEALAFAALGLASFGFTVLTYRLLTPGHGPSVREHLIGAALFTVGWLLLHELGAEYVARVVTKATALYGAVGAIFGVLAFLYLTMWWFLLCAEVTQLMRERPTELPRR
jgi:membrane protein